MTTMLKIQSNKLPILLIIPVNFSGIFQFLLCAVQVNQHIHGTECQRAQKTLRYDNGIHKHHPYYHHSCIVNLNSLKSEAQVHKTAKNNAQGCWHTPDLCLVMPAVVGPLILHTLSGLLIPSKVQQKILWLLFRALLHSQNWLHKDSTICTRSLKLADSFQSDSWQGFSRTPTSHTLCHNLNPLVRKLMKFIDASRILSQCL